MSKIIPREPVEIQRRGNVSLARQVAILKRQAKCEQCNGRANPYHIDHTIPLALGGADHTDNMKILCLPCHIAKTMVDKAVIARAKRLAGETRQGPSKTPLPFGRGSKLKKKLNGKVVER